MRKKSLVLLGAVLIGLVFHACSLPDSINRPKTIKIKGSPEYELLLNISGIDLGRVFIDMIREQLAGIGSEIFTVDVWEADYGQKELAFLLKLSTTLTNSLNPGKYLNGAGFMDKLPSEPFEIDYSIDMPSIEIKQTVPVDLSPLLNGATPGSPFTIPAGVIIPQMSIPDSTIPENKEGFFQAVIEEVVFKIAFEEDQGGSVLTGINPEFTFNARQDNDNSYPGLTGSNLSPGDLEGKYINKKELTFSAGKMEIDPQGAVLVVSQEDYDAGTLTKNLTVTMNIKTLKDVKWDFTKVTGQFQAQALEFPKYSLAEPAKYVKELDFDECDVTGDQGIGLKASFEKVIPGLRLNIKCVDIKVDETKELKEGDIVFGNTDGLLQFKLEKYKNNAAFLEYEMALAAASGTDILEIGELTLGEPQALKGKVEFFHHWTKAVLDMKEIIKLVKMDDGDFNFAGALPEDPVDLSILKDYIDGGITFDGIQTDIYLSGPEGALSDLLTPPDLEFSAKLASSPEEPLGGGTLYKGPLTLGSPPPVPDRNGRYTGIKLPGGGMEIESSVFTNLIEIILNKTPEDLYFQYNLTIAEELTVTYGMFNAISGILDENENENDEITVDVLVLLPLKLKVTDGGLRFLFKEYIGDQSDIFGRGKPGEETAFSNIKMPTLRVSLEFPEQFFSGGTVKLFADDEGNDPLFPKGIPLKGKNLNINVSGGNLNKILGLKEEESKLLILNPSVEFAPGDTIIIPRNMGLMGIKVGISGEYTIDAEDLGLW